MILYVDYEHASTYDKPQTDWLLAARTRIADRLQDLTGQRCILQRYAQVDDGIVEELGLRAVFISGNGADRSAYDDEDLAGLAAIIRSGRVPVFGFCGGYQLMGEVLGATYGRIGRLADGDEDHHPMYQPGWRTELGYEPVELVGEHPMQNGMGDAPVFRHAHAFELKDLPPGFTNLARTEVSENQWMAHETLPLAGTQFHPEYWTDEHPAGERLIANFCEWAGVTAPSRAR